MGLAETLPATFFGMHINQSTTAWPNVAFGSYRLWDDGTSWADINTSSGVYNWSPLDSWVSKAQRQNVQLLYTFGGTPTWASSSPSTSCNYGGGHCVAPADYTNWDTFVTELATRYKGKIKYYEMWNEPNDTGFWKGTTAQLVEMTNRAAKIIHAIDPNAEVLSPAATWKSTTAWTWLDGFLTAGGGPYLDGISFHGYTGNNDAEGILTIIDHIQEAENVHGLSLPLIVSEGGWGLNGVITDQDAQAAFLVQRYMLITSRPAVQSFFWYQWDNAAWGTLWDSKNGIHKAGVAYGQLTAWLIGATANGCSKDADSTWTCSFTQANGNAAVAVWNATTSMAYTPGSQYTQSLAIDGSSSSINGSNSYKIGNKPVLFTAKSVTAAAGNPDYTLSANHSILNLTAGQSATVTLTLTPSFGFNHAVSLSCPQLPSNVTCQFTPLPVMLSGTQPSAVQLTVSVAATTSALALTNYLAMAAVLPLGMLCIPLSRKRKRLEYLCFLGILLLGITGAMTACGGGGHGASSSGSTVSPAGSQAITVATTGGSTAHSMQLTLNISH
jgi:polysaccharide biosynthesis protein PslG